MHRKFSVWGGPVVDRRDRRDEVAFSLGPAKCRYLQVFSPDASVSPQKAVSSRAWCQGAGDRGPG